MAKKTPKAGGGGKTPRVNVSLPEDWHTLARRVAAANRQTVVYLFIDLLIQAAEKQGITDLPTPPWEVEDE